MKDQITQARVALLHPLIITRVTDAINNAEARMAPNMAVRVVQGYRTFAEQDAMFKLGRSVVNPDGKTVNKPWGNIVTNAKGGKSLHNYRLAADFALLLDKDKNGTYEELSWSRILDLDKDGIKDWDEVVKAFKDQGASWGGDWRTFKDYPHCEFNYGHDWRWFLEKHNKKDFLPGTDFIRL